MKYIYYTLLLSGLFILFWRWTRLDRSLHLFLPIYLFDIVTEIATDLSKSSYFMYHIDQTVSCYLLCRYYFLILENNARRQWVWIGFLLYICFSAIYFFQNPNNLVKYDPIDFVAEGVLITTFSLYYLIDLYRSGIQTRLSQHPHFWISAANLLFYSGASLFMGFAFTLLRQNLALYTELSFIVQFLNLMLYSIYIKAFLCIPWLAKRPN
jgi:hypothetical protein